MTFKNPLSEKIFQCVNNTLALKPDNSFDDLLNIKTLEGQSIGAITVYSGERIKKMVVSEFVMGPGPATSLVAIIPSTDFAVPRFGSDMSQMGELLHLDTDLFPPFELAKYPDYLQANYPELKTAYQAINNQLPSDNQFADWLTPYVSPYFYKVDTDPANQEQLVDYVMECLELWLSIYERESTPTSSDMQSIITDHQAAFDTVSVEHNPVKGMFSKLLGEPVANRILAALY